MHQGKHQEYEKRLHDVLIASSGSSSGVCGISVGVVNSTSSTNKTTENSKVNSAISNSTSGTSIPAASISVSNNTLSSTASVPQKEAWPSLSISPVNTKEFLNNTANKNKKDRSKQEKNKIEKNSKSKLSKNNSSSKDVDISTVISNLNIESSATNNNFANEQGSKFKIDKNKEKNLEKKGVTASATEHKVFEDNPKAQNLEIHDLNNSKRAQNDTNISEVDSLESNDSSINSACTTTESENTSKNKSGKCTPVISNENEFIDKISSNKNFFKTSVQSSLKLENKFLKSDEIALIDSSTKFTKDTDEMFAVNSRVNDNRVKDERNDIINSSKTDNKTAHNNSSEGKNNILTREIKAADTITGKIL